MYVSSHAKAQLRERLPDMEAEYIEECLEAKGGIPGLVAIVVAKLDTARCMSCGYHDNYHADDCDRTSNGDTVIAIVEDGSVNTVMYRRSSQPLTPEALGVRSIEDWVKS